VKDGRITVRLKDAEIVKLRKLANENKTTASALIRKAVVILFNKYGLVDQSNQ
tara:strand:+ start:987 stop:1145 length:159 start_codon:yes stop_codon:yes gene_type:complete